MKRNKKRRTNSLNNTNKGWKVFYYFSCLIGIISLIFEVHLYRLTIISVYIPIAVILIVGFIAFLLSKAHYNRIYSIDGFFFALLNGMLTYGAVASCILITTNYYFFDKTKIVYRFPIIEKSSMPGGKGEREKRQPLLEISYFGFEKELVFDYAETDKVDVADSVLVTIRKGRLGFDVLDNYNVF